jgi:hypothetical protein
MQIRRVEGACVRIRGHLIAETPTFIGSGRSQINRSLQHIPGSALRGSVGISLIKNFCINSRFIDNHAECKARGGCPYFEIFHRNNKGSSIIFRYAYPEHLGCKNGGVFLPAIRCVNPSGKLRAEKIFVCSSCGYMTSNPINLMRVEDFLGESDQSGEKGLVEAIPTGSIFRLDIILEAREKHYADLILSTLKSTLLKTGIGRWKNMGFGRFTVNAKAEIINLDDILLRAEKIDTANFSIKLISPMIISGDFLTPSLLLESARRAYSKFLHRGKPLLPEVKLSRKILSIEKCGGWSMKNEKPRPLRRAISAGSTFWFKSEKRSFELASALAALEYHAIGSFKPHGYGQVAIMNGKTI